MPQNPTRLDEVLVVEAGHEHSAADIAEPPRPDSFEAGLNPARFTLRLMQPTISFLASLIVHLAVLLVLALIVMKPVARRVLDLKANWSPHDSELQVFELNATAPTDESGLLSAQHSETNDSATSLSSVPQVTPGVLEK